MTMEMEKVTRNDLRAIMPGTGGVVFELPSQAKCKAVRSMVSFLNSSEGRNLKCTGGTKEGDTKITVWED